MFDKLIDKHKNPWNLLIHLIAGISIVYGLWVHDFTWIIGGIIIGIFGHIFNYVKKR